MEALGVVIAVNAGAALVFSARTMHGYIVKKLYETGSLSWNSILVGSVNIF